MKQARPKRKNSSKGSEELWLQAAYQLLIDSGVEAVKVMPLAKKLQMSRTSFYWHFEDREQLLDKIVDCWEAKNTGNLIAQTNAYAQTITEGIFNLFDCWIDNDLFDSRLDLAIRNWARNDAKLTKRLVRADQARFEAIKDLFLRFDYFEIQAETRALTILYTQVGYISMMVSEGSQTRASKMPEYIAIYTGETPSQPETERFLKRHALS